MIAIAHERPQPPSPAPGWISLARIAWRQWRAERRLRAQGISFRGTVSEELQTAYARMDDRDFDWINGRQDWANWRTVPRLLSPLDQSGPWLVLDLGCGAGGSTQVLAWHSPRGSRILGYDFVPPLLNAARRRRYVHANGDSAQVAFRHQPLTTPWCDETGARIAAGSVTLVNASGVLGHHVGPDVLDVIVAQAARVLAPRGIALLDVGPTADARQMAAVARRHGLVAAERARSCWLDPYGQIAFDRAGHTHPRKRRSRLARVGPG